jgi:hypothetical protein
VSPAALDRDLVKLRAGAGPPPTTGPARLYSFRLQQLAATFGLPFADRVVRALEQEVERRLERPADERTLLVIEIMEWAEGQHWPRFRGGAFDIGEGLDG